MTLSTLSAFRLKYEPRIPAILQNLSKVRLRALPLEKHKSIQPSYLFPKTFGQSSCELIHDDVLKTNPLKVGVLFSGGQAAGGHNVIAGLFDALQQIHSKSTLIGFLDGPKGVIEDQRKILGEDAIALYRNQGGFDLIGSSRVKIETKSQLEAALQNTKDLDGLVIIGGDDSNTNAALMAEFFAAHGSQTKVVGVPKTIDGDLRSEDIEISFGFDSACKTYAELIGNIAKDALSSKKYYHFIKLMGRSASHITLECALYTKPNRALIGEERKSLAQIVDELVDLMQKRKARGKEYGIILVPEGLIEFIPEIGQLIAELNELLASKKNLSFLSSQSQAIFQELPEKIQKQLTLERDAHGNVQVSLIETELLLIEKIKKRCPWANMVPHFLGYEGRSCLPTNFDANYGYSLGRLAALCLRDGLTGVIVALQNLRNPVDTWRPKAVPISHLIHFETRNGQKKPVIQKTLVDLKSPSFLTFAQNRGFWELEDHYLAPGPIQFFGDLKLTDTAPLIL